MTTKHGKVMKLHDKLKTYLQRHKTYDHNTYHGGDILQGIPTNKSTWTLNKMIMWGHVTNQMHYISTCRRTMDTKLGKVLTYIEKLPSQKPHDILVPWPTWGYVTI